MKVSAAGRPLIRFGVFELDLATGELRKSGVLIHLPPQPVKILTLLAAHPGELVTRDEIRQQVWGKETFVDFEQGLNHCIKQIRNALGDDAEHPSFIETLPRHGYRFIAPVDGGAMPELPLPTTGPGAIEKAPRRRRWMIAAAGGVVVAVAALIFALNVAGLRERVLRTRGAVREPPQQIQSIAVLPFDNLSHDPEQEYFADGMTEELITNLGKVSALRVISRTSVMTYKGKHKPLPEIAKELNVDAVVEGTVLRSGDRVRITANLLHAPTDRHLWAETYERDMRDVLEIQNEVAHAIVQQVQAELTPQERTRLASARPVNPEAYRLYLHGRYYFFNGKNAADLDKSIQFLQQALEKEPGYALAYAGLAESDCDLVYYGGALPKVAFPKAKDAALKALEVDSSLAEAHSALGYVLYSWDWNWSAAESELKHAIEIKPSDALAHQLYADLLGSLERHEQAISEIKLAEELDPLSLDVLYMGAIRYRGARRYDGSIEQCAKALALDPNDPRAHHANGMTYILMGKTKEATTELELGARLGWPHGLDLDALVFAAAGQQKEIRKLVGRVRELAKRGEMTPFALVQFYVALGDKQTALDWLEKGYDEHDPYLVDLKVNPFLDPLRSEPRFQAILRRMNFPP